MKKYYQGIVSKKQLAEIARNVIFSKKLKKLISEHYGNVNSSLKDSIKKDVNDYGKDDINSEDYDDTDCEYFLGAFDKYLNAEIYPEKKYLDLLIEILKSKELSVDIQEIEKSITVEYIVQEFISADEIKEILKETIDVDYNFDAGKFFEHFNNTNNKYYKCKNEEELIFELFKILKKFEPFYAFLFEKYTKSYLNLNINDDALLFLYSYSLLNIEKKQELNNKLEISSNINSEFTRIYLENKYKLDILYDMYKLNYLELRNDFNKEYKTVYNDDQSHFFEDKCKKIYSKLEKEHFYQIADLCKHMDIITIDKEDCLLLIKFMFLRNNNEIITFIHKLLKRN